MHVTRPKKLYLPAFTIIAVVLLLSLLFAIWTFRLLDHQKKTALDFLHSQGLTLLHAVEAGALAGMLLPAWSEDSVKTLVYEIGTSSNVAFIYIYDRQGIITHGSDAAKEGTISNWRPELENDRQVAARLSKTANGSPVYELAKRFSPESLPASFLSPSILPPRGPGSFSGHHAGSTVVLGMSMKEFEAAHRSDIQHAAIMAATLLFLGTGALFFTFVIQNYYLVDKALQQSREYLQQVMASMANGMVSIDNAGKITAVNDSALHLLGLQIPHGQQTDLRALINFESAGINATLIDKASVLEKEIVYIRGADKIPLALSVSPILDDKGHASGAVIILRDLTEIKRLEEKVRRTQKLAAIGELAAGVAHEVRNPLSSIRGFARFLGHVLEDRPEDREYADIMVKEVDRINTVVANLLSFARPVKPDPAPTDLTELIDHTLRLVQEDARLRNVAIRVAIADSLKKLDVDGSQLTQVMLNLVLNALQAVEPGGNIAIGARMVDADLLELSVEDDGPGISHDKAQKIFDPFYTTREKGTGLGLAIVHVIVENHGGDIRLASPVPGKGGGSRITIVLPVGTGHTASRA